MTAEVIQALDAISAALGEQYTELEKQLTEQIKKEAQMMACGIKLLDYSSDKIIKAMGMLYASMEYIKDSML